jgi:hypothetical protein
VRGLKIGLGQLTHREAVPGPRQPIIPGPKARQGRSFCALVFCVVSRAGSVNMFSLTKATLTAIVMTASMSMAYAQMANQDHAAHHPAYFGIGSRKRSRTEPGLTLYRCR